MWGQGIGGSRLRGQREATSSVKLLLALDDVRSKSQLKPYKTKQFNARKCCFQVPLSSAIITTEIYEYAAVYICIIYAIYRITFAVSLSIKF